MIKQRELEDPKSCLNKAKDDEMLFVLRGHDFAAPAAIRHWAAWRVRKGKNKWTDPEIVEALQCAVIMEGNHEQS